MINGDVSAAAFWWWWGAALREWLPLLSVGSAVGALALVAVVHLALSRFAPPPDVPPAVDAPDVVETVEIPRLRSGPRTGTLHGPAYRPVVADAPTEMLPRVADR